MLFLLLLCIKIFQYKYQDYKIKKDLKSEMIGKIINDRKPRYHITFYHDKLFIKDLDTDSYEIIKEKREGINGEKYDDAVVGIVCSPFQYVSQVEYYIKDKEKYYCRMFRIDDLYENKVIVSCEDCKDYEASYNYVQNRKRRFNFEAK